jgi:hypothetical protein
VPGSYIFSGTLSFDLSLKRPSHFWAARLGLCLAQVMGVIGPKGNEFPDARGSARDPRLAVISVFFVDPSDLTDSTMGDVITLASYRSRKKAASSTTSHGNYIDAFVFGDALEGDIVAANRAAIATLLAIRDDNRIAKILVGTPTFDALLEATGPTGRTIAAQIPGSSTNAERCYSEQVIDLLRGRAGIARNIWLAGLRRQAIPVAHLAVYYVIGAVMDSRRLAKLLFATPCFELVLTAYLSRVQPRWRKPTEFRRGLSRAVSDRPDSPSLRYERADY